MNDTQFAIHPIRRRETAFSLIEILIVISLIILLAGMVLGAASMMKKSASRSHTKVILQVCKSATEAYEAKFKPILHADPNQFTNNASDIVVLKTEYRTKEWDNETYKKNAPDASGAGAIDDHIERFVYLALKYKLSAKILKTLNKKQLIDRDGDGFLEIRDGFDNMLEYAAYVSHLDNYKGTYQEPNATTATAGDDSLPVHKHSFFGSSGIDGLWGNAETTPDGPELKDNLYSYDQD